MKLREVVYWVVILLQVMLLTGVSEKQVRCWYCQKMDFPSVMTHVDCYGWFHQSCVQPQRTFDEAVLELPIREDGRFAQKLVVKADWR